MAVRLWPALVVAITVVAAAAADEYGTFLLSGSNFEWPSVDDESNDILYGRYEPRKVLARRVQMDDERAYVIMPSTSDAGVPWTLGAFRLNPVDFEPDIRPYPGYRHYGPGGGGGTDPAAVRIVNAMDAYADSGVLWVLDSGMANAQPRRRPLRVGPAQLIAVNLTTDEVIKAVDLSPVTGPDSQLEYVVARRTSCGRQYVYASDAGRSAMAVYDVADGRLHAIPLPEKVSAAHHRKRMSLYLMAVNRCSRNYVYFTFRQSSRVYALDAWRNESVQYGSVSELPGVKPADMVVLGTDRGTTVYFRAGTSTDVWAWDVNRPLDANTCKLVYRGYLYMIPTAVVAGWRCAIWSLESNLDEYEANAVDCTGARALLRPFRQPIDANRP